MPPLSAGGSVTLDHQPPEITRITFRTSITDSCSEVRKKTAAFRKDGNAAAMNQTSHKCDRMRRCEKSGDSGVLMHKPLGGPGSR